MLRWFNSQNIKSNANNIVFADAEVKRIMVANFDTTGDGEISYTEAASITVFSSSLLRNNYLIITFDEFQYFTGLTELETYCFSGCALLTTIIIPNTIVSLGSECFRGCVKLESLILYSNLTTLGERCFQECEILSTLTLPQLVTILPAQCVSLCYGLNTLIIEGDVTSIGEFAFFRITADILMYSQIPPTVTTFSLYSFYGNVYVPDASLAAYKAATYWSEIASRIFALSDYSG